MKMLTMSKIFLKKKEIGEKWKNENEEYIRAVEKFLDRASNIQDEELRESVINNMLICDRILTKISEDKFKEVYEMAYKDGKKNK